MAEAPALSRPIRRSPLHHRKSIEGDGGAIRIAERPFLGKAILRADKDEAVGRLRDAFDLGLPFDPLTSSTGGGMSFLWLGPDEWMIVTEPDAADDRFARARQALADIHHQLVKVGDYYTVIEISGPRAREALMKLTTLDLHPRAFKAGMVAGSMFGKTQATLWQVRDDAEEGGPLFRLIVRWSMADYLWCLVADAAREFGAPEERPVAGETLTIG
jgi:sarcosine oxidase, subunit gamma